MQRIGFTFRIKPELKAEYKKAHDEIWPELAKAINDYGMHNYSIYFRKDGTLFAYLEVEGDFKKQMEEFSKLDVNKRYTTEIVASTIELLGRKGDDSGSSSSQPSPQQNAEKVKDADIAEKETADDDLPF